MTRIFHLSLVFLSLTIPMGACTPDESRNNSNKASSDKGSEEVEELIAKLRKSSVDLSPERYIDYKNISEKLVLIGEPAVIPLIETLKDRDYDVRLIASGVLEKIGKPSVKPLVDQLNSSNRGEYVRRIKRILQGIGAQSVNELSGALASEDIIKSKNAADILGQIGEPAISVLIVALGNDRKHVQENAFAALEDVGESAIPPLLKILDEGASDSLKIKIMGISTHHENKEIIPYLIKMLKDNNEDVRLEAWSDLNRFSREDFGFDYDKWKKWYDNH